MTNTSSFIPCPGSAKKPVRSAVSLGGSRSEVADVLPTPLQGLPALPGTGTGTDRDPELKVPGRCALHLPRLRSLASNRLRSNGWRSILAGLLAVARGITGLVGWIWIQLAWHG